MTMHSLNSARFGVRDPAWSSVVQLAHFDGADNSTTLTNQSPIGDTMVAGSTDVIKVAQSVFGGASLRHTTGTLTSTPTVNTIYQFTNADYTVEFRYRPDSLATVNIFDMRDNAASVPRTLTMYTYSDGKLACFMDGAENILSAAGVIVAATWHAIAVSRVSGTTRLFVDGTQRGSSFTDGINYNSLARCAMGSWNASVTNCYWDELRISNGNYGSGAGRYAGNYTIATAAFPNS